MSEWIPGACALRSLDDPCPGALPTGSVGLLRLDVSEEVCRHDESPSKGARRFYAAIPAAPLGPTPERGDALTLVRSLLPKILLQSKGVSLDIPIYIYIFLLLVPCLLKAADSLDAERSARWGYLGFLTGSARRASTIRRVGQRQAPVYITPLWFVVVHAAIVLFSRIQDSWLRVPSPRARDPPPPP